MTIELDEQDVDGVLKRLLDEVRKGNDVSISSNGGVVARLIPVEEAMRRRAFGAFEGQIRIADDFDEPLPDDELRRWGML